MVQRGAGPARARPRRRCTPAPASRSAPRTSRRCSRWTLIRQEVSADRFIDDPGGGARRLPAVAADARSTGPAAWRRPSARRPGSTTSTRGSARPGPQAQHRGPAGLLQRQGRGYQRSPPRPGPGSGAARSPSPARSSASTARSGRSGPPTTRSRTGALMMETYGRHRAPLSPSRLTEAGADILAAGPGLPARLGIAICEAVEVAASDPDTRYALGSVLNHVLMHQTVIGEEAIKQLAQAGETMPGPDRRLHRRRVQLRRAGLPVPAGEAGRPDQPGHPRGRARRLPLVHPRRRTPTTSATRPGSPRC